MGELIYVLLGIVAIGTVILVVAVLRADKKKNPKDTNNDEPAS